MTSLLNFIALFTRLFFDLLLLALFLRVILSWFPVPIGKFTLFLRGITDPLLHPLQRLQWTRIGVFDFSVLIAFFALQIMANIVARVFIEMGANPNIFFL